MKKVLVTGANGFIGRHLSSSLSDHGYNLVRVTRNANTNGYICIGDIGTFNDWRILLNGVDVVVHCAAWVHKYKSYCNQEATMYSVNYHGTLNLAIQAAAAGVKRFIFISTIAVNGLQSKENPFTIYDTPNPSSPYAKSKFDAELSLRELSKQTGMELVIIRPPLVYGPNAPGNFNRILKLVDSGFPIPLGGIKNKRSFVYVKNLIDLIRICLDHPSAANQIFLVSDNEDVSTSEFFEKILNVVGKTSRLITLPAFLIKFILLSFSRFRLVQSLFGSLEINIQNTRQLLGWIPPYSLDESLQLTFQEEKNK